MEARIQQWFSCTRGSVRCLHRNCTRIKQRYTCPGKGVYRLHRIGTHLPLRLMMANIRMHNLYCDDASEEYHNQYKLFRKVSERISNVLQADQDTIQDSLHKIAILFPQLKDTCDVLENQSDHLDYLALRDLGRDDHSEEFLDNKERFLEKLHLIRRRASDYLSTSVNKEIATDTQDQRPELRKVLNELDFVVATERAILRVKRPLLELDIPSYEGIHKTIGHSYARCITEYFAKPSLVRPGSTGYRLPPSNAIKRQEDKHWSFRHRLLKCCHPENMNKPCQASDGKEYKITWCPVLGAYPEFDMVAAQIIPYTIEGRTAAHLLGRQEDECECIWSADNGMMLGCELEKAFDEGSIVFVPFQGELKLILLNQSLANRKINSTHIQLHGLVPTAVQDLTFGSIDGQLLRFKTSHRPSLMHLYVHTLMAVFRRRRHRYTGWETDIHKVFAGKRWPDDGKLLRRGALEALVAEVGDLGSPEVNHVRRLIIDGPLGMCESQLMLTITAQDCKVAVAVAGTWASQKQCEIWANVSQLL